MGADTEISQPVIYFDGVCNLCNAAVNWVIDRDLKGVFLFASLQSSFAAGRLPAHLRDGLPGLVLEWRGQLYFKSDAALQIARILGGWWRLLSGLRIIPLFFRDWVYDAIAARRYRWFGKMDACRVPTPELAARFRG